jgi:8-oxo-dGTP pyrophosphatase MutT (NUDIX family)
MTTNNKIINVNVAMLAIVNAQKEVLLLNHIKGNLWGFPGGKVDPGDTYADTVIRETHEELGVVIGSRNICKICDVVCQSAYDGGGTYNTRIYELLTPNKYKLSIGEPHKHNEMKYFSLSDIGELEKKGLLRVSAKTVIAAVVKAEPLLIK